MSARSDSSPPPAAGDGQPTISRPRPGALPRRELLRFLAASGATLALASCGANATATTAPASQPTAAAGGGSPAAAQPTTNTASKVKRGGRLIEASVLAIPGWDAHLSNVGGLSGYGLVYETLLRYELVDAPTARFELRPGLAERWEQPDPRTIVLNLRRGIKFHDGSDFNAEVVKWNLDRLAQNPKSTARSQLTPLESVEVIDPYALRLKLKNPSPAMLLILSDGAGYTRAMMSKAQFDKVGEAEYNRNPAGTGPMRLKSWVQDDRATLEPFKEYWELGADGKPLPYLDEFVSRFIPDLTTALVDLQAGGVDVVVEIPPKDVPTAKGNQALVYETLPWWGVQYFTLGFNTKKAPFDNPLVRRALLTSLDREGITKAVGFGVAQPQYYPYWSANTLGYDETIPKNEFNLDGARQLLAEAGLPNGFETEMKFIRREPDNSAAEYQQQIWAKIGVKVKIQALERLAWLDEMGADKFDIGCWRGGIDIDPELNTRVTTNASANFSHFSDPEIDRLMREGNGILDARQRQEIYKQVVRRIQEQAWIGSGFVIPYNIVRRKHVQGLTTKFSGVSFRAASRE